MSKWRKGNDKMGVYRYVDAEHKHRMGSCEVLPVDGDLVVCTDHSGDCFDSYVIIRWGRKGFDTGFEVTGEFGAYVFGEKLMTLPKRDYHLLLAGEMVFFQID